MPVTGYPSSRRMRGVGRFPFLLLLAMTAALVYLMIMFIPAYLGNQQMRGATEEIVRRGALQNLEISDVKAQLQEKARECGLPANHQIQLWREGKTPAARVIYTQAILFPFYTYQWPF